ncbi:MAG: DUF6171 family protein [Pirellulales bacterium]
MSDCNWSCTGQQCTCTDCGKVQSIGPELQRNCPGKPAAKIVGAVASRSPSTAAPGLLKRASNFLGAIRDFIHKPGFVTAEEYAARLDVCDTCKLNKDGKCQACGCTLTRKARAAAWHCPLEKWPGEAKHVAIIERLETEVFVPDEALPADLADLSATYILEGDLLGELACESPSSCGCYIPLEGGGMPFSGLGLAEFTVFLEMPAQPGKGFAIVAAFTKDDGSQPLQWRAEFTPGQQPPFVLLPEDCTDATGPIIVCPEK